MTQARLGHECPKSMTYGPCGGVGTDGSCEVDNGPCPFITDGATSAEPQPHDALALHLDEPMIVVDVRAPPTWRGDQASLWRATAEVLQGCVALLGEHVDNPVVGDDSGLLSTTEVIAILREGGVDVIATVTGRDRRLDDAARSIRAFRDAGVTAIHCVTGDHPAAVGIDRPARFGAEAMTLIGVAIEAGVPATVAESPASPGHRAERLASKQRAGASLCLLNHAGDADDLITFADEARAAGATMPLIAPVAMVADKQAALALATFPGLRLPHGLLDDIIEADDPATAGLDASRDFVRRCATSSRFGGVNLSGGAGGLDPWDRLELTRRFIDATKAELRHRAAAGPNQR